MTQKKSLQTKQTQRVLVSVVIPVFNGAAYLLEAVESVQKSTYRNIEILLINDGSSDQSKFVCKALSKKYRNVKFHNFNKNRGLGRVLNHALSVAKGKYIARINQDDIMRPYRITKQVAFMESHPDVTAMGGWINAFDNHGMNQTVQFLQTDKKIKSMWFYVSPFADPTVFYRRDVARKVGGYDQYFWPGDDTHLWYRLGMKGKLANLQEVLTDVRIHDGAASYKFFRRLAWKTYEIHRWAHKNIGPAPLTAQLYWLVSLVAGYTLTPAQNWNFYRIMKRCVNWSGHVWDRMKTCAVNTKTMRVKIHPKKLNFSGV
jgi:glycosyltransferase involved in cell wall biosynthesis